MSMDIENPDFVASLARGLEVISCFGPGSECLAITDVATKTGLSRGTARRFLLTLEALGYARSDGRTFSLTPRTLNLGYAYLSSLPLWKQAQPIMAEVVATLDQSCSLGVLDGADVVYIARMPPRHLSYLPVSPGTRMPAHVNAMGQALLASLPETELDAYFRVARFEKLTRHTVTDEAKIRKALKRVARDGYALSDRQIQMSIRSIAVPVPTSHGRGGVAINASAEESRASKQDLIDRFLPVLLRAADKLAGLG